MHEEISVAAETAEKLALNTNREEKENDTLTKKEKIFYVTASFILVMTIFLFYNGFFHPYFVSGHSMDPTLHNGQVMYMTPVKDNMELLYGDIVVLKYNHTSLIKRVVGLPGDTLVIRDGKLYVNDVIDEHYDHFDDPGILSTPVSVGDDAYFVIGDNINHSADSRVIGAVFRKSIKYKATEEYRLDWINQ